MFVPKRCSGRLALWCIHCRVALGDHASNGPLHAQPGGPTQQPPPPCRRSTARANYQLFYVVDKYGGCTLAAVVSHLPPLCPVMRSLH